MQPLQKEHYKEQIQAQLRVKKHSQLMKLLFNGSEYNQNIMNADK